MTKHFRSPLFDVFRTESPFECLRAHAEKAQECINALVETTKAFVAGDHEAVEKHAQIVSKLELDADRIKADLRNHLPGNIRMPVDKALFLQALHEQDHILDEAEDAAMWMSMRETEVPEAIGVQIIALLDKVVETVAAYEAAVSNLDDLVETGFVRRERDEEKTLIERVHELEYETDVLQRHLSKTLLRPETEEKIGALAVYHLLKLALQISKVADHAEDAGDRIRAMLAK